MVEGPLPPTSDPLLPWVARLRAAGDPTPRRTAARLAAHVTGCDEVTCLTTALTLTQEQASVLATLFARRLAGEPLQYVLGYSWFMGHAFAVGPGVLIPRPDSEVLVTAACARVADAQGTDRVLRFADVGTGSGCIGLSLALACDQAEIAYDGLLTDTEATALAFARRNHRCLAPRGALHIVQADLLPPGVVGLDLLVSNPPYIPTRRIAGLMPEVAAFEPHRALDGGADGLACLRRLIRGAPGWLAANGWLMVEHGHDQGEAVRALFHANGCFDTVETIRDWGGHERVTAAQITELKTKHI